jgi:hypothetical protein
MNERLAQVRKLLDELVMKPGAAGGDRGFSGLELPEIVQGIAGVRQLSCKVGLLVIFTPMSELRDFIVPRLSKANRQMEEKPRQLPIRSSC